MPRRRNWEANSPGQLSPISPFKPVLHGQAILTKLNIVDEFGQVVSAFDFDKTPSNEELNRQIYPFISDAYSCTNLVDPHGEPSKVANAVVGDQENRCAFFQIPPSINQDARLNAFFVTTKDVSGQPLPSDHLYRSIYEQWENPVWGWVLVNYASHGIQFFLPDGKFYGQVLLGGSEGTDIPVRWQPFKEPPDVISKSTDSVDVSQLEELMKAFRGDPNYLKSFIHMIITGRYLAHFGVSLELAQRPKQNQSTINNNPPPLELENYTFPCVFGDKEHKDDGLVGYFAAAAPLTENPSPRKPDFSTCYTYFPQAKVDASEHQTVKITTGNSPTLNPHYIDPLDIANKAMDPIDDGSLDATLIQNMSSTYEKTASNHLKIFTAIVNPFTPFHIRTGGLLPTKALELPPWVIKSALEKIDVFFPAGPILSVTNPLTKPASRSIVKFSSTEPGKTNEAKTRVQVPTPPVGEWIWKQPFVAPGQRPETDHRDLPTEGFKAIEENDILRVNEGQPLTAIEGYLCMNRDGDRGAKEKKAN